MQLIEYFLSEFQNFILLLLSVYVGQSDTFKLKIEKILTHNYQEKGVLTMPNVGKLEIQKIEEKSFCNVFAQRLTNDMTEYLPRFLFKKSF